MVAHNILLMHRVIYHFTESRAGNVRAEFLAYVTEFLSRGPGNVRAEFLAYVTEFLTRGPGMYIIYMNGDENGYDSL